MRLFQEAKAVWLENPANQWNQFVGFHTAVEMAESENVTISVAARSYYRLYINGSMVANGPARSAEGTCRVDQHRIQLSGYTHIAVEVTALNKPEKYCNDCTLEHGLLAAEIINEEGTVISATGSSGWTCQELNYRRSVVETMSHSRGIVEYYDLMPDYLSWTCRELPDTPAFVEQEPEYLKRHSPYPIYRKIPVECLLGVFDMGAYPQGQPGFLLQLGRMFNPQWYSLIPEENKFLEELRQETEEPFTGSMERIQDNGYANIICVQPGKKPACILFENRVSEIGFLALQITVEKPCILDIVNSDHTDAEGYIWPNTYVTRYELQPGRYNLTTFEPKLVRYVKVILRTTGKVELSHPSILEYTYPDGHEGTFTCSDGDLNRIYDGARRTLRLCTLDLFMDCPQRERGGWLCDSYFSGEAAWQMFGDANVERDMLDNFLRTDPDAKWNAFFPEVYPGVHSDSVDVGIRNWSYWLMLELCAYYRRTGDKAFMEEHKSRVTRFVNGLLSLRGEHGLPQIEGTQFVDWSLANKPFAMGQISIPNSCLAVYMLEQLGEVYEVQSWKAAADDMRCVIEKLGTSSILGLGGDGATYDDGVLKRNDCRTEGGIALELWSGFFQNDRLFVREFVKTMGTCPEFRPNPNYGRANLFIGLILRFGVLSKMDRISQLVRELKNVYLEELKVGSGTYFENINALAGCHGANGYAGALLSQKVLGIGEPNALVKTIEICPHPCGLRWCRGSVATKDGLVYMSWSCDEDSHTLNILLNIPKEWTPIYKWPFELNGWTIFVNDKKVAEET